MSLSEISHNNLSHKNNSSGSCEKGSQHITVCCHERRAIGASLSMAMDAAQTNVYGAIDSMSTDYLTAAVVLNVH